VRVCEQCGKELRRGILRYCSRECYSKSGGPLRQRDKAAVVNECLTCGKQFEGRADKYCSIECYHKSPYRKGIPNPRKGPDKQCVQCGKSFHSNNGRFCSMACRSAYFTGRPRASKRVQQFNACAFCGCEFPVGGKGGRHKTSVFCSPECHLASQRKDTGVRAWNRLARQVIERDGHCVICGNVAKRLQTHHITPRDYTNWSDFVGKETADDLVTVCPGCHQAIECLTKAGYRNNPSFNPRSLLDMVRIR
jgi:hypothetical protein